jgi:bacteriophage HK97-gp10 putative tail-component
VGKQAARIGAELRARIAMAMKMLALEIDRELRRNTPVDTGHARRNWIPSVGSMNTTEANDDGAHQAGVLEVLSYKLTDGALWVANVVDYVHYLNYGTSDQQPAGFIERSVDIAFQKAQAKISAKGWDVDLSGMRTEYQGFVGGEGAENLAGAYSPFGDD